MMIRAHTIVDILRLIDELRQERRTDAITISIYEEG